MRYVHGVLFGLVGGWFGWALVSLYTMNLGNPRYYPLRVGLPAGMMVSLGIYYLALRSKK
jgi:hypothetical protein